MSKFTVMSYNICYYNFDIGEKGFPSDIMDKKVSNLKQLFMQYGPDVIGLQEDYIYIDAAHKIKTEEYLFSPIWTRYGTEGPSICHRIPCTSTVRKMVQFSTGRYYRRCLFKTVSGEKILFITAHPTPHGGADNVAKRLKEYTELFDYINTAKFDACIVVGDMNTLESVDKKNLNNICDQNKFTMAIGSYIPWVPTCLGHDGKSVLSLDNIMIKGAKFNKIEILSDWYDRLYSDHLPIVAEIELV